MPHTTPMKSQYEELFVSGLYHHYTPRHVIAIGYDAILRAIAAAYPGGVDAIVVHKSNIEGWTDIKNSKGAVAVVIGVKSPRDVATGQATGKRQHMPVRIRSYYGVTEATSFVYHNITWTYEPSGAS